MVSGAIDESSTVSDSFLALLPASVDTESFLDLLFAFLASFSVAITISPLVVTCFATTVTSLPASSSSPTKSFKCRLVDMRPNRPQNCLGAIRLTTARLWMDLTSTTSHLTLALSETEASISAPLLPTTLPTNLD